MNASKKCYKNRLLKNKFILKRKFAPTIRKISTLIYKIRNFFWTFVSNLVYHKAFFIDTNLILLKPNEVDRRPKQFSRLFSYFVTETIQKEIVELDSKGKYVKGFNRPYKTITFARLRSRDPSLCPVYYTLISAMYNPATIASPEFYLQMLQSLKLRGRTLTKAQNLLYMKYMDKIAKDADSVTHHNGKLKTPLSINMDKSLFQYFKKKIKNRNSKNLLNDYKSLALSLLFALTEKKNVTFVTADRDLLAIMLTLSESLAQHISFHHTILPSLSEEDKKEILCGKKITRFVNFDEFSKLYNDMLRRILSPYWKNRHISFRIRLWDDQRKSYTEDLVLKFDFATRELLLNCHGSLSCRFAKNNTYGNWLYYRYWPPTPPHTMVVKFVVWAKKIINSKNTYVPDFIHDMNCKYAIDDKSDNLKRYTHFRL